MRKIWQTYKYIFYWLYTWQRKLWGEGESPEHNASIGMVMSMVCNIFSFILLIDVTLGVKIFPGNIPKQESLIMIVALFTSHYFMFIFKKKYKDIEEEFMIESEEERKNKGGLVLLYTFGSILFFVFLIIFVAWIKS
jgi:hypothetical protein